MSKKEKGNKAAAPISGKETKAATVKPTVSGLLDKLDRWFDKHEKKVFYFLLFCSLLFSILLFDSKVSEGGDDSGYIQRAWELLHEGKLTYFQGPGYPMFLSIFVKLFGLDVIMLKTFSVLCQLGFVWVTYLTFRKRVPNTVLFALLAYISFNHYFQYYASQTYTETFFLFVQSICLFVTFKIIDSIKEQESLVENIKQNYLKWLLFGLVFVLLSISKSIAIVGILAVVIYFIFRKNFKQALFAIVAFMIFRFIYQYITASAFGPNDSDQMELILRKNLYKPADGHEDVSGMITRFFNNFNTYISVHMYRLMNIRGEDVAANKFIPALSYISAIILVIYSIVTYRLNKFIFFCSVYLIVLAGAIFFGIQAQNMQDRLIIIIMPLIFLVLFGGTYYLVKKSSMGQSLFVVFASIMLIVTIGKTAVKAKTNTIALKKNLSGDIYYGYTDDWINFLKMSKYCADSLPDSAHVLSRKPNMSFIYGNGKKFNGQFWVTSENADTVLAQWKKQDVEYLILASIRQNPKKRNGMFINTIHRMLGPVLQKYPEKVSLVKSIGDDEKCELVKIRY